MLEIDSLAVYVVIETLDSLNLVNLGQIHLVLYHGVARFNNKFSTLKLIYLLRDRLAVLVFLHFRGHRVRLELFQHLLPSHDLLYLVVFFSFLVSAKYVLDRLQLLINDEELTLIFCGSSPLVNDRDIPFDQVEFLQAE